MERSARRNTKLPWGEEERPLMLAPMQGLTNRALRSLFIDRYAPDIVFTEYVLVRSGGRKPVSPSDRKEISLNNNRVPLVVQLIGSDIGALTEAAKIVQGLGAEHLNINLGCPYGRMTKKKAGGVLLQEPSQLERILSSLRPHIQGSFSVKVRSGMDDSSELPSLIEVFERSGVDFIIVHPRTVQQKYEGVADHQITAEAVRKSSLPVIANGDIFTKADGRRVLEQTGAAGLMLGRGAIADPFLFERIRGRYDAVSTTEMRAKELREYLLELLDRYKELFCGEQQVVSKMKEVVVQVRDQEFRKPVKRLLRSKGLDGFVEIVERLCT